MNTLRMTPGRICWCLGLVAIIGMTALTIGPLGDTTWEQPELLFSLVSVAAAACIIGATVVIALADRRDLAEIGLLGSALMAASVLPLVHGLVTPGVLYDDTPAFRTAAFLTLPVAVAVAAPLLLPHSAFGRWAARRWRDWSLLALVAVFVLASIVVFYPDAIVVPAPDAPATAAIAVVLVLALGALSLRQLRLHELGGQVPNLVASLALLFLAAGAILPMVENAYSAAFWWFHLSSVIGVLGACAGFAVSRRMTRSTQEILTPVLVRDPLAAFELGLSPVVHRFVADLERKDQATRDHTVRTGEMAIRVGERLRLPARRLRELGLAAMLHDVGKLHVPAEILNKPGRLTAEEYEVVQLHTVYGEEMLAAEPALAAAAPIVRSHHERPDGRGYPDALAGRDIPLAARIIAVCDAFDAMTHERPHRAAMTPATAYAVLREHAGSQWDPVVIEQLMAVVATMTPSGSFEQVGRDAVGPEHVDGLPEDLPELLAAVDAEI